MAAMARFRAVSLAIESLSGAEQKAFVSACDGKSLKEIAKECGNTKERTRQILVKANEKMEAFLFGEMPARTFAAATQSPLSHPGHHDKPG